MIRCDLATDWAFADKNAPLYAHMETMDRLPIPEVEPTLEMYLHSIKPYLSDVEFEVSKAKIETFGSELADTLYARLCSHSDEVDKATAAKGGSSWLAEWWDNMAYLDYRDSIAFYVSYFYHFTDDLARKEQCSRAASLISGFAQIGQKVTNGTLAPEPNGKTEKSLCSNGYKFLFHSCRVPEATKDAVNCYNPKMFNGEILISRKNKLYSLNITGLTTDEIEAKLKNIVVMAGEDAGANLGAMTAASRDAWYSARTKLLTSSSNAEALEMVERSMFCVCLDDIAPITPTDVGRNGLNGHTNRFFDKTCQIIVYANGKACFIGEHAKSDGSPTARLCDDVLTNLATGAVDHSVPVVSGAKPSSAITAISFETTDIASDIADAEAYIASEWEAHNWRAVRFTGYGNTAMKGFGISPDAYVQMAMQLAYYRLNGKPCGTYESIMTRGFLHGRTEVGRSTSIDSLHFSQAMDDPTVSDASKVELLQTATTAHSGFLGFAAKAEGVDRVLLGLKQMLTEEEAASPAAEIYTDPVFAESGTWKMSTSHLISEYFDGWGYGEVTPDGFGCSYTVKPDTVQFNVVSKGLDSEALAFYLEQSLLDMADLCVRTETKAAPRPKL